MLEKIRRIISDFLLTDTPEVISIRGGWGTGKTHFWNAEINNANKRNGVALDKYAYVSLFGISSLDELKYVIFDQIVNKSQIGQPFSFENFKANADDVFKKWGRKTVWFLQSIPSSKNPLTLIRSLSFMSVRKTLICIDDFERKGDLLPAKDVLGLVSLLKEQRDCKVVLIFNDSNLSEASLAEYKQFREKVIDLEVIYSPTAIEASSLVFNDKLDKERLLSVLTNRLNIKNIRILKKIKKVGVTVANLLDGFESKVVQHAMHTVVLFVWCYYSHDANIPPYEYVKENNYFVPSSKGKTPEMLGWDAILREYEYFAPTAFDLSLATLIENGFPDTEQIKDLAENQNKEVIAGRSHSSFSEAYKAFTDSFDDNEEALVIALQKALIEAISHISALDLDRSVQLLRQLKKDDLANDLIRLYITTQKKAQKLDLGNYAFAGELGDSVLIAEIQNAFDALQGPLSLDEVLEKMRIKDGWAKSDEAVLANASVDDFQRVFKRASGKVLSSYIDLCLRFERLSETSAQQKSIAKTAKLALQRIGSESNLNKIRVKRYGIDVD